MTQQFQADLAAAEAATAAAQQQLEQVRYHALPWLCGKPIVFQCVMAQCAVIARVVYILGLIALLLFTVPVNALGLFLLLFSALV